jgi:hypothetical protein
MEYEPESKIKSKLILFFSSFFMLSLVFIFIVPPSGTSDADYHLSSIWCNDSFDSNCSEIVKGEYFDYAKVPASLGYLLSCSSRDISIPPDCSSREAHLGYSILRTNTGLYPGLFYELNSLLVGSNILQSILLMRILSLVFFLCILLLLTRTLRQTQFAKLQFAIVITLIPFPLFYTAGPNPKVMGYLLTAPAFFALSEYLKFGSRDLKSYLNLTIGLLCSGLIVGARPDGFVLASLILLSAIVVNFRADLKFIKLNLIPVLSLILCTLVFFPKKLLSVASRENMNSLNPHYGLHNVLEMPGLMLGILGGRGDMGMLGLGSYDLPLPTIFPTFTLIAILIGLSFYEPLKRNRNWSIFLIGLIPFLWFLQMDQVSADTSGMISPSYYVSFVILAVSVWFSDSLRCKKMETLVKSLLFLITLGLSGLIFFFTIILRYSSGIPVENAPYITMVAIPLKYVAKEQIHWQLPTKDIETFFNMPWVPTFTFMSVLWGLLILTMLNSHLNVRTGKVLQH